MDQNTENTLSILSPDPNIHRLAQRMQAKKKALFQYIRGLPVQQYSQAPSPGSWSVAQAANHLYLSEKLSLAYLRKKMAYPEMIPPYHVKSWLSVALVKLVLKTNYKVKAPKTIDMWQSQEVYDVNELEVKWDELRSELFTYINESYPDFKNMLVFNHPFAGRLTMRQMLIFMVEHIDHHTRQIRRIARSLPPS